MKDLPLIIGHRGASSYAPENTLAAIKLAVDLGSDGVEFDVQLASDGVPVVIHDDDLRRTGSLSSKVADLSSEELRKVDVGSWFNVKYPKLSNADFVRQTVPTLTQVLDLLEDFHGLIYIELKPTNINFHELTRAVCGVILDSPLLPQIIVKSFHLGVIREIKHHLPKVQTAALFGPGFIRLLWRRKHIVTIARECGADQISLHYSLVTKSFMSFAAAEDLLVTVWTVDDPKWVSQCRDLGIKATITNDPAKLLTYREKNL